MGRDTPVDDKLLHHRLVSYFHDCLAALTDWARAVNVIEQKDVTLVPLSADEVRRFGGEGILKLSDPEAVELAKRVAVGGSDVSLVLGALFLVGRIPPQQEQSEKRFFAPLLEVPLTLRRDFTDGHVVIEPEEAELTLNYSLIGELIGGDDDDLQDRLADLTELTPDFPIDAAEFDAFWNGFRMIFPEVPVSSELPTPAATRHSSRIPTAEQAKSGEPSATADPGGSPRLRLVDFFIPQSPKSDLFHLLPATALVLGPKSGLAMSALSELAAMGDMPLHATAFGSVFGPSATAASSSSPPERMLPEDALPLPLTPIQEAIVRSARTSPLTVVTGPPGTGKSYTIAAIVLDALLSGQTVLVSSQMDKAVEVVADKVGQLAGPYAIVRSGGRQAQRKLAKTMSRLTGPSNGLDGVTNSAIDGCTQRHRRLTRQMKDLERRFQKIVEQEQSWSEAHASRERFEPICTLPIFEVGKASIRKSARLVDGARRNTAEDAGWMRRLWGRWQISRARRLLKVPNHWSCSPDELGDLLGVQLLKLRMREAEAYLKAPFPADLLWRELAHVEQQRNRTALELLRLCRHKRLRVLVTDPSRRAELRRLATLLRRRKRELKLQLQEKISPQVLLQAFPAWACTSRSLCEILPATAGLFDVVVIDEASQCDPALASVALMRGKRAVVVGDPQQLRHVCFLSRAREQAAFARWELTPPMQQRFRYRRSVFDIAADAVRQENFFLLNEHFRSHPQIIEFSNQRFYDGALQIMTSRPTPRPESVIQIRQVGGRRVLGSSVNLGEVDAVAATIKSLADGGASQLAPSIGVVSPFRDHADAIRERLIQEFPSELLDRHAIVVGTAHSLQGDEKDIVVFSTSIDPGSHPASLRFLENANLFNVAVTRPRRRLIIVTSVRTDDLPPGVLREYLSYAASKWSPSQSPDASHNAFQEQVVRRLKEREIAVWPGFQSAGKRIHLVAMGPRDPVAILCDSSEGGVEPPAEALGVHRRLVRAGWKVMRVPQRTWLADWHSCCEAVANALGSQG